MITNKRLLSPSPNKQEFGTQKKQAKLIITNSDAAAQMNLDDLFEGDDTDFLSELANETTANGLKQQHAKLDLRTFKRCIVQTIEREKRTFALILHVHEDAADNFEVEKLAVATCQLQGPWCQTRVKVGNLISLQAIWDAQIDAYKVDKDHGFCITNADTLIPVTSVVGSHFCQRKTVLQERFRGIDAGSKVMVIGSLVHELFQNVLKLRLHALKDIEKAALNLFQNQNIAFMLYSSMMTLEEAAIEINKFVPNIHAFIAQYFEGKTPSTLQPENFAEEIAEIADIEENLWVPQLGLKGKVDVSVRLKAKRNGLKFAPSKNMNLPLELKTGRASFSMEHKGQLILYQMMLSALEKPTASGLLLYLREGIMREIKGARNEQRDLIILRNNLAHYLCSIPSMPAAGAPLGSIEKFVQPLELPEPISHHSACSNCAYATLCCAFAKTDAHLQLSQAHPLHKVMQQTTAHLQEQDLAYLINWCGLLALEEQEAKKCNFMRQLCRDAPETRQQHGRAVINLRLLENVVVEETRYLHSFKLDAVAEQQNVDLTLCGLTKGEYVIVSSRKRLAIAAGCILELSMCQLSISLERNLLDNYAGQTFIVDKHESQSYNIFNFTNLGLLLEDTEKAQALRNIVIHKQQPTFVKLLPKIIATAGATILKQLNSIQRAAVLKALTAESFMLIKGLPGTGKTQTLVAIVRLLHAMGKSVIITSHTHSAVDNLLLRLVPHALPMLRLGSGARVNAQLLDCSESKLLADCHNEADLARVYNAYNIVGVTCLGAAHSIFLHRQFDVCIVDEATQVMQPTVLRALHYSQKFILVGDPDQLPPLIRAREARLRGADESLFQRLDSKQATSVLTLQYRMNKTITKLANELTYAGALRCATADVEAKVLANNCLAKTLKLDKWLQRTLQTHIDQSVFWLDTLNCAQRSYEFASTKHSQTFAIIERSFAENAAEAATNSFNAPSKRLSKYTNYCEAAVIFEIVTHLLRTGQCAAGIGIIAPYRAQVELLRKLAMQHHDYYKHNEPSLDFSQVEVNTVDQYQGRDKDIILYSCARTGAAEERNLERARESEILEDKRRLTVAITRAKMKLILIGDAACLQQYTPFSALLSHIPAHSRLKLEDGKLEFQWQSIFDKLSEVISKS